VSTFRKPLDLPATDSMAMAMVPGSFNAESNEIDIVWLDGLTLDRRDCCGDKYVLHFNPVGCHLDRANSGAPFLWNHPQAKGYNGALGIEPQHVIGNCKPASVMLSPVGKGTATIRLIPFNPDPIAARPAEQQGAFLVANGYSRGISQGWRYDKVRVVEYPDTDQPPDVFVDEWTVLEFSAAPIQEVEGAATAAMKEAEMPKPTETPETPVALTEQDVAAAKTAGANDGAAKERARTKGILATVAAMGLDASVGTSAIDSDEDLSAFRDRVINERAADTSADRVSGQIKPGRDSRDKLRDGIAAVMFDKAMNRAPSDASADLHDHSVMQLYKAYASALGVTGRLTDQQAAKIALGLGFSAGMQTPSDLPNAMEGVGNRSLKEKSAEYPIDFNDLVIPKVVPDFRVSTLIGFGLQGTMEKVPAGGKPTPWKTAEEAEGFKPSRFMGKIVWSWEDQQNDDLGVIGQTAEELAKGHTNARLDSFWTEFMNGTYGGVALYDATHANVVASQGADPSVAQLGKMRKLHRKQVNISGRPMNAVVSHVIFNSDHETAVDTFASYQVNANTVGGGVPKWVLPLKYICQPRLDVAKFWYTASVMAQKCFVEAVLKNAQEPMFRMVVDPETLAISWILDHSWVHKAVEFRGVARNKGEA